MVGLIFFQARCKGKCNFFNLIIQLFLLSEQVAMYKRLYEEEHKLHSSAPLSPEAVPGSLCASALQLLFVIVFDRRF